MNMKIFYYMLAFVFAFWAAFATSLIDAAYTSGTDWANVGGAALTAFAAVLFISSFWCVAKGIKTDMNGGE